MLFIYLHLMSGGHRPVQTYSNSRFYLPFFQDLIRLKNSAYKFFLCLCIISFVAGLLLQNMARQGNANVSAFCNGQWMAAAACLCNLGLDSGVALNHRNRFNGRTSSLEGRFSRVMWVVLAGMFIVWTSLACRCSEPRVLLRCAHPKPMCSVHTYINSIAALH